MANIDQLERKIVELENRLDVQAEEANRLLAKSNKLLEITKNAYKLDGFGFIWAYDSDTGEYHKTNMRVMSPEVADRAVMAKNIADNAIEGRHIQDDVIEGRMIKNKTIDGRSLKNNIIGPELIANESIPGDCYTPDGVIPGKLANDAVSTRTIQNKAVTASKIGDDVVPEIIMPQIKRAVKDLQNQIDGLDEHGVAVSNEFGDNLHIGVSQKALTDAINKIWAKIEDMTGEVLQGFDMQITPEYFIGETGADVHITANTVETNGIFEHIAFYGNRVLITEADNVDYFEYDPHIDETTVIQCVAKIMGIEYSRQSIVTHYSSFFMGSGDTYEDMMIDNRFNPEYAIPITNGMRGAYDVNIAEGKRLIIVVGDSLKAGFIRADLNGVEIQFTESPCTDADGKVYAVFTSEPWSKGEYNIDING